MEFTKLSAPSLKEMFVKELESLILSGKLKIGEKLPPERELAANMQVSRAVINSGIAELSRKGFLEVKPRSGIYVKDYRRYGTLDTLVSIMSYNGGQLRNEEVRSFLEMKYVIDRLGAALAIERASDEEVNRLEECLKELAAVKADNEKSVDAVFRFYHELSMISENTILPLIYSSFQVPVRHLWMRFIEKNNTQIVYESAKGVFEAIKKRDRKEAIKAVENAVTNVIEGKRKIYEDE